MSVESGDNITFSGPLSSHPERFVHTIWPQLIIALGLTLSLAWTVSVGYGIFQLAHRVMPDILGPTGKQQ